ncbi:hypothetical protein FOZG_14558 [Fusarium oxysporum Fo47]|uniref:Protein-S-isoprenylcysteine O-methyltransferase n=1 Tax=Fusarium oxysporum Fo47 TaxID=660027 RepID=W9JUX0_FUSOX|nr:hypothetical protein FOZG_14558 [Fusarium oxysporum Fo47]
MSLVWHGWATVCSISLIALRLLIGAAEAKFIQIGMYYLSNMYPKYLVGFREGIYRHIESPRFHRWQDVFLLEGGVTVLLGILNFFIFPKGLATAWFLPPEERLHAVRRMEIDLAEAQEEAHVSQNSITK